MLAPTPSGEQKQGLIKRPRKGQLKLDLGCGTRKQKGFRGIDILQFKGVDYICDLTKRWPLADLSVDEVFSSHFLEHLTAPQRCHFFNELWRVLLPDGKATIVVPHWSTCRAYGDPTHQWPPIGEFLWYYLDRTWRNEHAPHTDIENLPWGYACDFHTTWGYGLAPTIVPRAQDFQTFAVNHYREAIFDLHVTITKRNA